MFNNKLLPINKGNATYQSNKVCRKTLQYTKRRQSNYQTGKKIFLSDNNELWIRKNISCLKSEKVKKDFQRLFKENELDIVIQCNMKVLNYSDVTLNLEDSIYRPYQKK